MASLYKRPRSPFWWIKYRDPITLKVRRESTSFRFDNGPNNRAARQLAAQRTAAELAAQPNSQNANEAWDKWVPSWIERRYQFKPKSALRYSTAWRSLRMFLDEYEITLPRQLTREHCSTYLDWRSHADVAAGKYRAGHNTALLELKFLALVMKEAVLRQYAPFNPARELGFNRAPVRKPHDFTTEGSKVTLAMIQDAIAQESEKRRQWLLPSFLIARYHGVRLSETVVNLEDVRLWQDDAGRAMGEITFHQKGRNGLPRVRTKPLHPLLLPFFQDLKTRGVPRSLQPPKSFAKEWHLFFLRHGFKNLEPNSCFHSLRVVVENQLRRAGIPKEIRKKYLSHESGDDVNASYDRVAVNEMRVCHAALS